jgi:hypothetical protein
MTNKFVFLQFCINIYYGCKKIHKKQNFSGKNLKNLLGSSIF